MASNNIYRQSERVLSRASHEELNCDICNSTNVKEIREGYACGDCGIVLEIQRFQYYRPYNLDSLQNAVLGATQIGTKRERLVHSNSVKLESLQKLQAIKDHEKIISEKAKIEISRILSCLALPSSHKDLIFRMFRKFRKALKPGTKYRSPEKLVPLCIYYSLKLQNASINQKELLDVSKITKKEFNAFKLQIKLFIPEYTERNRKDYILQKVLEISEQFELGMEFFYLSKKILYKFWEEIKCTTDDVIAGLVSSISVLCSFKEKTSVSAICNRIGIRMSTIQAQVKKRIFDRFQVNGFTTLKKSADMLRKIMVKMGMIYLSKNLNVDIVKVEIEVGSASNVFNALNNFDYYFFMIRDLRNDVISLEAKFNREMNSITTVQDEDSINSNVQEHGSLEIRVWKHSNHKGPPLECLA